MYILLSKNGKYYTGSTKNLKQRLEDHMFSIGSNFTFKNRGQLVYYEEYDRIDEAFSREKQVKKWSHKKKLALIKNDIKGLKKLAECQNKSHSKNI